MPQDRAIVETACRVLKAISAHEEPADVDVAELHRFAPDYANDPLDVLACYVVELAMELRRLQERANAAD